MGDSGVGEIGGSDDVSGEERREGYDEGEEGGELGDSGGGEVWSASVDLWECSQDKHQTEYTDQVKNEV